MQQIINNLRLQNSSFHQFSLPNVIQPDFSLLCIIPFQISTASQPYFMERTCHVSNCVKNLTHNVENGWMHKFICLMNDDLVGKRGCFSINKIHLLTIISLHFFFYKKNVKHLSVQQSLLKYENCTWYTLDHIDLLITCITKLHNNKQEYTCICDVLLIMLKRNMIIIAHIHQSFHKTTHFA